MAEGFDPRRRWMGISAALLAVTISCAAILGYLAYSISDEHTEQELAEAPAELPEASLEEDSEDPTEEDQFATADLSPLEDGLTQAPASSELKVLETRWGELSVMQLPPAPPNWRSIGGGAQCGFGEPRPNQRGWERRDAVSKTGQATAASEAAVDSGLAWLARQQQGDGSWNFQTGNEASNAMDARMGATGMALLAFLGAGHTQKEGKYASTVRSGLNYLTNHMRVSSAGGDLRGGAGHHGMYSHGICSVAICEAYVMTKDRDLRRPAQLAIDFIVNAQHEAGGWHYEPHQAGDISVSGWQIEALMLGKIAKLRVPSRCIGKAVAFLNSVQSDGGAQYGYDQPGGGPTTSAIGLLCRMYTGWDALRLKKGVELVGAGGPQPNDVYFNYYAAQVMRHWGGSDWKQWNVVMREQLVKTQETEEDAAGSWSPANDRWGKSHGGRLYTTCLSILTLEVYYRQLWFRQLRKTMKEAIAPADIARDPALLPFSIDLLQTRPESVRAEGTVTWDKDRIQVNGSGTLRFEIPPNASFFTARGSLNSNRRAKFFVHVDDRLKYRNDEIEQGVSVEIHVPLESGNRVLELTVNGSLGQGLWLEPRWTGWQEKEIAAAPRDPFDVSLAPPLSTESGAEIRWTPQSIRPSLPGSSCLRYPIPEGAKRFSARGATLGEGRATFGVRVDGVWAFRSEEISKVNWTRIDILLPPGSQVLELRTDSTTKESGQALWTEPRFSE